MITMLIYGMPNSGKSTISYELVQRRLRNTLIIDGDKHREMQFLGKKLGFSREHIMHNTEHVIKLAKFAQDQGFNILIAQITPYVEQRELMSRFLSNFVTVYCHCPEEVRSQRPNFVESDLPFEVGKPDYKLDTSNLSLERCVDICADIWYDRGADARQILRQL
jgi:adenylylsulfate kinase-like enzyme